MNLENPNKLKWKNQYLGKYRELLGISNLKISAGQSFESSITPIYLDHIDKVTKSRSKSIRSNYTTEESYLSRNTNYSVQRKLSENNNGKIYSANQMTKLINHAKICGLINRQQQNENQLQQNRQYFQEVRNLQKNWHYNQIRQEEKNKQFNLIPMEQHLQFKIRQRKVQPSIQQLIQEQRTLHLTQNSQNVELSLSSSLE